MATHEVRQYVGTRTASLIVTEDGDIDTPGTTLPAMIADIQNEITSRLTSQETAVVRPQRWVLTVQSAVDVLPVAANWPMVVPLPEGITGITTADPENSNPNQGA